MNTRHLAVVSAGLGQPSSTRLLADRSRARGRPLDPRDEQFVRLMCAAYGMFPLLLTAAVLVGSLLAA